MSRTSKDQLTSVDEDAEASPTWDVAWALGVMGTTTLLCLFAWLFRHRPDQIPFLIGSGAVVLALDNHLAELFEWSPLPSLVGALGRHTTVMKWLGWSAVVIAAGCGLASRLATHFTNAHD